LSDDKRSWGTFFEMMKADLRVNEQRLYFGCRTATNKPTANGNYYVYGAVRCRMRVYSYFRMTGCILHNAGIGFSKNKKKLSLS
jgi:hypothetical protein